MDTPEVIAGPSAIDAAATTIAPGPLPTVGGRGRTGRALGWLWADRRSQLATTFLVIIILLAIFAPLVSRIDPAKQDFKVILQGPSWKHWLGTDDLGRDMWSRLVYGARVSLEASVIAVVTALIIGLPLGLVAGYRGGWVDTILMRIADTLLAFPGIVLAIGITAALGTGLSHAMIAVGVVFSPSIARVMRGQVIATKERLYVDAANTFGLPAWRIVLRHIVPNSIQPVVIQATFMLGLSLLAEASLSFLGLGVQPPQSSWGIMLQRAAEFISRASFHIYAPGLAIAFTVLSFNALGDSLRDQLDPVANARRELRRAVRRGRRRSRRAG